jgi:hypothetical protein
MSDMSEGVDLLKNEHDHVQQIAIILRIPFRDHLQMTSNKKQDFPKPHPPPSLISNTKIVCMECHIALDLLKRSKNLLDQSY